MCLQGRVALVTGGAGYLGKAICETLAEQGAAIAVLDIKDSKIVANDIASRYRVPTFALDIDLADKIHRRTAPKKVFDELGRLDILVSNAAYVGSSGLSGWTVPFADQTVETWCKAIEVNLTAVFDLCQASLPYLSKEKQSSIINIASIYGLVGPDWTLYEGTDMGSPAAYAASKGGVIQFSRWLATTVAPLVRVNVITPGGLKRNQPENFLKRYEKRTPLRRMANEEDFKGAIAFLASDASSYITGQNIVIDGGWTAW